MGGRQSVAAALLIAAVACGRIDYASVSDAGGGEDAGGESDASGAAWWDESWSGRIPLRFDARGISGEITGLPVPIRLAPSNFDYARAAADGRDLRFVSEDGGVLPHEIETWSPGGASYLWIRVPRIASDSDETRAWLYYENPSAGDAQAPAQVWSDFHAVYHLNESVSGAGDQIRDSAGGHHGQGSTSAELPVREDGKLGGAQRFDGVDDLILVSPADSFNFESPGLTIESWIYFEGLNSDWNDWVGLGGYDDGYRMGVNSALDIGFQITGATYSLRSSGTVDPGAWHYIVGTWDGSEMRIYVDGAEDPTSLPRPGSFDPSTNDFAIGKAQFPFPGLVDELRIANTGRPAAWIQASHRAMRGDLVLFE